MTLDCTKCISEMRSLSLLRLQFVSPHTGLVYQKHVTGLCQFMQDEVELEVRRAQAFGKLRRPEWISDKV